MPQGSSRAPAVGDRVLHDGVERIVTDIRDKELVLRPLRGMYREIPARADDVTRLPDAPHDGLLPHDGRP